MAVDYGEDMFQRIVAVHWPKRRLPTEAVVQQGLMAVYENDMGGIDRATLRAVALDSGQTFEGVLTGASGMGYTVLTKGLVCFGKPINGEPCFLACPDYYGGGVNASIMRGVKSGLIGTMDDPSIEIGWGEVTSGNVVALSFAAGAFFVVYQSNDGGPTSIATSYDGISFSTNQAYPYDPGPGQVGGSVAGLMDSVGNTRFVSCGSLESDIDNSSPYYGIQLNLAWSTSSSGLNWSYGANTNWIADPGSFVGSTGGTNVASAVAAGNGIFVAAATSKDVVINDAGLPYVTHNGAVATSSSGSSWNTIRMPGAVPATKDSYSSSSCVTFVQINQDKKGLPIGYFLCGGYGYDGNKTDFSPNGGVWRSPDGSSWSQILQHRKYTTNLSAIAKDLSKTKIINL